MKKRSSTNGNVGEIHDYTPKPLTNVQCKTKAVSNGGLVVRQVDAQCQICESGEVKVEAIWRAEDTQTGVLSTATALRVRAWGGNGQFGMGWNGQSGVHHLISTGLHFWLFLLERQRATRAVFFKKKYGEDKWRAATETKNPNGRSSQYSRWPAWWFSFFARSLLPKTNKLD
ncbi:hypothetical protein B0H12DRAFT_1070755 [Mycena haematopus]|nr:hypothetical protein B0H12DRAFT_1070755 [Mycena haematopus]